ncbi:MAG: hypothetical protein HYS17_11595 [Micavibrio aeruginosavorus]|uniref:Asl1-like glycosyl hydrolase catalytic domain-containing protein n=1 Tax=Micavibrio aeruginosavorus TaxID=349221 RepID=A0A7T5R296_9BACT|nr:MAG: hypothetical protein HYS17_11595 [Micavibrio aeruginosavorus]
MILFNAKAYAACALSPARHPSGIVGLQLFHPQDARSWEWARDLDVEWVRIEIRWDFLEPEPGKIDEQYYSNVVSYAGNQKIMLLFNHAPRWAVERDDGFPEYAARAVSAIAAQAGENIKAWEIFNEPNLPGFGWPAWEGNEERSALQYARTFSAVSASIREHNKQAFIVTAGLSPDGNDPENFLRLVVRDIPASCYDAIGIHPYGRQGQLQKIQDNIKTVMNEEGLPQKPIWFTEFGTEDSGKRDAIMRQIFAESDSYPILFWFSERDLTRWGNNYGLREYDGSGKTGYNVFKTLNRSR